MSQKRFAFLFGANGPEGANLKPLQYAQNDIKHLRTAFLSSFCNFHQATDHIADTASILLTQLERFAYACERPDLLVIHFSGHGFVWKGQLYLLCNTTDVDAKLFNSTAINIIQVKTVLDQCRAKHKFLILDCCFAGIAQAGGTWKSEEQLPGLESLKGSVNAILAACPAHRRTRELDTLELYKEKGAGFLSWAITRACDEQFTQVARENALSLSDIVEWLPRVRDNINKSLSLSPEDCVPAPRILHERDLVGDDEIWFTSRRRSNSYDESQQEKRQHEEHALFERVPFLQRPCLGARSEDFDIKSVQEYAQYDGDAASLPSEDLSALCQQLRLTNSIGTPINAAVLAFHKAPSRYIHSALIRTTCYIVDEQDRYVIEDIKGPLRKQIEHALRWLFDNLRTISENVGAGRRADRCEIPEQALREIVANAIVHRNYETNSSVQIKVTPKQVIITNPGELNSAITLLDQPFSYRESLPVNPFLLDVLITQRWVEGRSRGFAVVTKEFQKYGLPLPEIKNLDSGLVQVIIQRPEISTPYNSVLPYLDNQLSVANTLSEIPADASTLLRVDVLLVTVTEIETKAVLRVFQEKLQTSYRRHFIASKTYYDLGIVNDARIFLVQSEMGVGGPGSSFLTVYEGIQTLGPSSVIMVGIAFGVDPQTQRIGDVLVSQQLHGYELQRYGTAKDGKPAIIPRGDRVTASAKLLDHFKSASLDWPSLRGRRKKRVYFGAILSGEKLIDNIDYRDQLLLLEPEAIGGEMEGVGLYAAAQNAKVDWILVKGICDWADGNKAGGKRSGKENDQTIAANSAAQFTMYVLANTRFVKLGLFRTLFINAKKKSQEDH